ncbi:SAM-dependent methytransferase [Weissella oryzae SG25]|uniref:SAM-dependent methytransferase n=1 Tax=Weissella oryzae (strain DSM 25784 / JCM 18191 / LMG 30913 / SG25) TaxID=1329250 RepID=A0A069CSZ3_WEIOS|nr:class I SAM-dependent methyltransferase [Weissella oryzae]GAK30594.1 SAM-dependent methytransferase [Weissella oryzae SG25]
MNYTTFAKLYDELFDQSAYEDWLTYTVATVKSPQGPLLELAGGAGRLAIMLKQAGFPDVTVFDLSEEMLTLAAQHADEADIELPLIVGDMREWSDYTAKFATITSFADSFNYLANEAELLAAFKQVADHLVDQGQFVFDVITPYQTDVVYPGYMYNWHDDERAFMWSSYGVEAAQHTVEHELTFFVYQNELDAFQQVQEIHTERTYELEQYKNLLAAAGFTDIEVTADFGKQAPDAKTTRWFFNAKKK